MAGVAFRILVHPCETLEKNSLETDFLNSLIHLSFSFRVSITAPNPDTPDPKPQILYPYKTLTKPLSKADKSSKTPSHKSHMEPFKGLKKP